MTQNLIYNLNDLTSALNNTENEADYDDILSKIRFNFKDIEHLCFWDAEHYSKINVGEGENYELNLICWESQQQSKIHQHLNEKSWIYVIKGEITEKTYHPINGSGNFDLKGETILTPRKSSHLTFNKNLHHHLANSNPTRSVSLHLYVK
ncbi:MAG: cysteine dioxygenase family protein [Vicingaceae bacterium]|nr:cysteine dioxygenase family protein [Vicingaceae bacterium]